MLTWISSRWQTESRRPNPLIVFRERSGLSKFKRAAKQSWFLHSKTRPLFWFSSPAWRFFSKNSTSFSIALFIYAWARTQPEMSKKGGFEHFFSLSRISYPKYMGPKNSHFLTNNHGTAPNSWTKQVEDVKFSVLSFQIIVDIAPTSYFNL